LESSKAETYRCINISAFSNNRFISNRPSPIFYEGTGTKIREYLKIEKLYCRGVVQLSTETPP